MRLPDSLLARLRAPIAAVALAGCSGAPTAPIAPDEPAPIVLAAAPAPPLDPVRYDPDAEAARLDRDERAVAAELERRDERIAAARPVQGIGQIGHSWSLERMMAACGRG
jgi:hypothetical protein